MIVRRGSSTPSVPTIRYIADGGQQHYKTGENVDAQVMLSTVEAYVLRERNRRGIVSVGFASKPEPSGEAFDEFVTLLENQLMTTAIGYGAWDALADVDILNGVYRVVESRSKEDPR
jgi:hypothetical protein